MSRLLRALWGGDLVPAGEAAVGYRVVYDIADQLRHDGVAKLQSYADRVGKAPQVGRDPAYAYRYDCH